MSEMTDTAPVPTEAPRPDLDTIEAQANEFVNGTSERGEYFTALDVTLPLIACCRRLEHLVRSYHDRLPSEAAMKDPSQ